MTVEEKIEEVLNGLNEEQKQAVKHIEGPCYVVAGPGSGKTRVIVARTQYMILNGINPSNIVLFTFTNKAAREIKERIVSAVGDKGNFITIGTYHSVCSRILRTYATHLNYERNFTILDADEARKILKKIADKYNSVDTDYAIATILDWKKDGINVQKAAQNAYGGEVAIANIYRDYQKELHDTMCMDFDDLLLNTIKLMENFPEIKKEINNKFKYVSRDEAHDSATIDLRLIKLISGYNDNLCMIFDDYQSIYSFRGADVYAVMNFKDQFKDLKTYYISNNYRCSKKIVEASKSLISHNTKQMKKNIVAARDYEGDDVIIVTPNSSAAEYATVTGIIKMLKDKGLRYDDIAILYRTGFQSRGMEQKLIESKMPYKIYGGVPFYSRMEVADILSYVKFIINKKDFVAFERSIGIPKRGIGEKSIEKIENFARENYLNNGKDLWDALPEAPIKGKAKKGLDSYISFINSLEEKKLELPPAEFLEHIIKELDYISYLNDYEDDPTDRIANLVELVNVASQFNHIEDLLEQASLYALEDDSEEKKEAVQLMTMHSSKGLEFKAVIIIGAVEGTNPHFKAETIKEIEEERRLFYVAATRAKDYLFISAPTMTMQRTGPKKQRPSRFIEEIDDRYKAYL